MSTVTFSIEQAVKCPLFDHYSRARIEKFLSFHAKNPHVLDELEDLALKALAAGRKHYSLKTIYAVLRWNRDVSTTGDEFKLNDLYQSLYVRALIVKRPELHDFFELRVRERQSA